MPKRHFRPRWAPAKKVNYLLIRPSLVNLLFILVLGYAEASELPQSTETATAQHYQAPQIESFNPENLIIQELSLEGLKHLKESQVRSQIKTRKGEVFDNIEARADLKRLMKLGVFAGADVDIASMTINGEQYLSVRFILQEKSKIKKVTIQGARRLSKGTIRDILAPSKTQEAAKQDFDDKAAPSGKAHEWRLEIDKGAYFDETTLAEALRGIEKKYEEKSIFGSTVGVEREFNPNENTIALQININEGRRAKIGRLRFENFASFPASKIKKWSKVKEGRVYKVKNIDKGVAAINEKYKENGWLDFTMTVSSGTLSGEELRQEKPSLAKKFDEQKHLPVALTYSANEGKRHHLLGYNFKGQTLITETELRNLAKLENNKTLQESKLREAEMAILNEYRNKGHLFASIDIEKTWPQESDGVYLTFHIEERQPVYIGSIYVEGLLKTKEHCIKREILLKEGDLFNARRLYRSQEKIFNLGFIEDIRADYDTTANPNFVDLIFDVKEGHPGTLTAGAGFSSLDGVVGQLTMQHLNLFGRVQRINLSTEFGKRRQSFDARWTTPWTMGRRVSTTLAAFNTSRSLQFASTITGFKKHSKGGSVFFSPRFEEDTWIFGAGYSLQEDRIFDVLEEYKKDIPESLITRSAVTTSASFDTRDYRWDPKRGTEQTLSTEFVGGPVGGNVHFIKPSLRHAFYLPTVSFGQYTFVLSSALRWGFIKPYKGDKTVPVSDRFFVGGAETVRGYSYTGEIGPIEGGRMHMVGNIEYKIPLIIERRLTVIQSALFFDFGGAWRSNKEINFNFGKDLNKLKAGVGFGIRFKTPAFPIRLDWGWGLHHRPGESRNQFYFTIGDLF